MISPDSHCLLLIEHRPIKRIRYLYFISDYINYQSHRPVARAMILNQSRITGVSQNLKYAGIPFIIDIELTRIIISQGDTRTVNKRLIP